MKLNFASGIKGCINSEKVEEIRCVDDDVTPEIRLTVSP
jgi:hypothetical protein